MPRIKTNLLNIFTVISLNWMNVLLSMLYYQLETSETTCLMTMAAKAYIMSSLLARFHSSCDSSKASRLSKHPITPKCLAKLFLAEPTAHPNPHAKLHSWAAFDWGKNLQTQIIVELVQLMKCINGTMSGSVYHDVNYTHIMAKREERWRVVVTSLATWGIFSAYALAE